MMSQLSRYRFKLKIKKRREIIHKSLIMVIEMSWLLMNTDWDFINNVMTGYQLVSVSQWPKIIFVLSPHFIMQDPKSNSVTHVHQHYIGNNNVPMLHLQNWNTWASKIMNKCCKTSTKKMVCISYELHVDDDDPNMFRLLGLPLSIFGPTCTTTKWQVPPIV